MPRVRTAAEPCSTIGSYGRPNPTAFPPPVALTFSDTALTSAIGSGASERRIHTPVILRVRAHAARERDDARVADPSALIHSGVTPREIEVLRAVQEHLSNAEIAARLFVSERTVESHVSSLLRKLQASNRRELARLGPSLLADTDHDPPTNLPCRSTTFIGRAEELDALDEAIRRQPLLTLVGPGGVGKTRLALEAASRVRRRYPGGTWFVDFAPVRPERVPRAVAEVLNLTEQPGEDLVVTIASALAHRPATLVILDNCDQLVQAAGELAASILASGGPARIVATSRQVFGTDEECLFPVSPLPEGASIELFLDRARRIAPNVVLTDSDTETLTRICRHLDHLPLAIELAATQTRLLEPAELAKRLDDRFRLLSRPGQVASRQGSIAATVGWSYEQLHEPAKRVFERLSVFAGSCTVKAAEAVCAGDGVDGDDVLGLVGDLVDRSMLTRERALDGMARYRMLETLRLYGRQWLEATGDLGRVCRAHATYCLAVAQAAEPHLFGPEESVWTARLRAEEANLRVALVWAREHDAVLALRLGVALWQYWNYSWGNQEAVAYLRSLLEMRGDCRHPDDADHSLLQAWALTAAASLSSYNREADLTRAWAEEAIDAFALAGEDRGLAYAQLALGWLLPTRVRSSEPKMSSATSSPAPITSATRFSLDSRSSAVATWRRGGETTKRRDAGTSSSWRPGPRLAAAANRRGRPPILPTWPDPVATWKARSSSPGGPSTGSPTTLPAPTFAPPWATSPAFRDGTRRRRESTRRSSPASRPPVTAAASRRPTRTWASWRRDGVRTTRPWVCSSRA